MCFQIYKVWLYTFLCPTRWIKLILEWLRVIRLGLSFVIFFGLTKWVVCMQKKSINIVFWQWSTRGGGEHSVPIEYEILSKDKFSRWMNGPPYEADHQHLQPRALQQLNLVMQREVLEPWREQWHHASCNPSQDFFFLKKFIILFSIDALNRTQLTVKTF